jgi:uncharacterized circularly permuted ATP-grasp superfamily protein/uncharacterized alpha-E superfamily protein
VSLVDSSGYPVVGSVRNAQQAGLESALAQDPEPGWLLQDYRPLPGVYDSAVDADGDLRPHYRNLIRSLESLGQPDFSRRADRIRQVIEENGVTFNVYSDPRGVDRPWEMDLIPLIIEGEDWRKLSAGLEQRARLLNLILQDIHGPMRLLREGWIPPELVWANPNFLRTAHDQQPAGGRFLHLHSVDLARGPAGGWWVIGDRTQSPSGAGYALNNRVVTSRVLPDEYRSARVQRLAPFFQSLRSALSGIAPRNAENPRVCILTPGPYNETYFEHTFLARYLGFTLVEGGDLTKRDNRIYLKTLAGLLPVDVILRRLDDGTADPLELRPDSALGLPGLALSAALGEVAVANPLGSGVVETAALMAFLPGLCRHLLDEDLLLPSVATWWCGQPEILRYVEEHLDELILKPAFPGTGLEPIFCDSLTSQEREQLIQRVRRRPHAWVAQEPVQLATAPAFVDRQIVPMRFMLRTFAAAGPADQDYQVLPGGLARISTQSDGRIVSMQHGEGSSKDTWVLADQPVKPVSLLPAKGVPIELKRGGPELFSRVADNMYWLGRYVERAEGATRLLRVVLRTATSELSASGMAALPSMLASMSYYGIEIRAGFPQGLPHALATPARGIPTLELGNGRATDGAGAGAARPAGAPASTFPLGAPSACSGSDSDTWSRAQQARFENDIAGVMLDRGRPGNLRHTMKMIRQGSRMVRDRLSADTWRVLSRLVSAFADLIRAQGPRADLIQRLDDLILTLAAFSGLGMESSTRNPGWRFLDLGRRVERSIHTLNLLSTTLVFPPPPPTDEGSVLQALLETCDSSMTYRSRYLAALDPTAVLDLLLTDETNPRSVAFQAVAIHDHVANLPRAATRANLLTDERLALTILSDLRLAIPHDLARIDLSFHPVPGSPNAPASPEAPLSGGRPALDHFIDRLLLHLPSLSDALTQAYLSVSIPGSPVLSRTSIAHS